jgi:hypothetical protein
MDEQPREAASVRRIRTAALRRSECERILWAHIATKLTSGKPLRHRAPDKSLSAGATVRAAIHREVRPIPEHVARRVINRFDRAVNRKMFQRKRLEGDDALNLARSLGEAHGWKETSFDLWHLAAAGALSASVFLTFDRRQKRIASLLGMA